MQVIKHRTDSGTRIALLIAEGKRLDVLYMGEPRLTHLPRSEARYISQLPDYKLPRAKRKFRDCLRRFNGGTLRGLPKSVRGALL